MIGERFCAETESIIEDPVPEQWLALMRSLNEQEEGPELDQAQAVLDAHHHTRR
jgi:hypothetical protein